MANAHIPWLLRAVSTCIGALWVAVGCGGAASIGLANVSLALLFSLGCSSSSSSPQAGTESAGGGSGAGGAAAGGAPSTGGSGGGSTFEPLNGCAAADFISGAADPLDRVVVIDGTALTFTPKCLAIPLNESVQFIGDFSIHPLAPGSSPTMPDTGSPGNPITVTTSGKSQTFTFTSVGTFPYFCSVHFGSGMMGVIRVD